jgi:hypothetical protein
LTLPPPLPACVDLVDGWADSDGDSCDEYRAHACALAFQLARVADGSAASGAGNPVHSVVAAAAESERAATRRAWSAQIAGSKRASVSGQQYTSL